LPVPQVEQFHTSNGFDDDDGFGSFPEPKEEIKASSPVPQFIQTQVSNSFGDEDGFGSFPEPKEDWGTSDTEWAASVPLPSTEPATSFVKKTEIAGVDQSSQSSGFDNDGFGDFPEPKESDVKPTNNGWDDNNEWVQSIPVPSTSQVETKSASPVPQVDQFHTSNGFDDDDGFGSFPEPKEEIKASSPVPQLSETYVSNSFDDEDDGFGSFPEPKEEINP